MVTETDPIGPLLTAWALSLLDHQNPDEFPDLAAAALGKGIESPSLIDLAGRSRTEHPAELRELLGDVIEELGYSLNQGGALLWTLYSWCAEVLRGDRDAESISRVIYGQLSPYVGRIAADYPSFSVGLLDDLSALYPTVEDDLSDVEEQRITFDAAARRVVDVVPTLVFGTPPAASMTP